MGPKARNAASTSSPSRRPQVVILAGPNGAGKTTVAPTLLRDSLNVRIYVNADVIAQGLSGFDPETHAVTAGRLMLAQLKQLGRSGVDFAFETTLASRSFARWFVALRSGGYVTRLVFLYLPSAEAAVHRVRERVQSGGHSVPEDVVRRRYERGLANFFGLYRPLMSAWRFYDNTDSRGPRLIAERTDDGRERVQNPALWDALHRRYADD